MTENPWPPKDGRAFIHSEDFGSLVVSELDRISDAYPQLDLADAAAIVFHWFNKKLNANGHFVSKKRFPSVNSFRAYVRQMLFNAGMYARRVRTKNEELENIPEPEAAIDPPYFAVQDKEELLNFVDQLEEPWKTIFTKIFFDEEDVYLTASALDITEQRAHEIYEEAVDQIQNLAKRKSM